MPEPVFIKLSAYVTALEPISTAYFFNPSHQSVSTCIPPIVPIQWLGKHVLAATNTRYHTRIVGGDVFFAA
jgi:hypothetical protein